MGTFRILKIYRKFRSRRWQSDYTVPEIRLQGKWLEKLGFTEGAQVKIKQQRHQLIITLLPQEKEETNKR
ncbi:SymE family type I addiction module toxin [Zunongwangia pacifica]|uniref:Type I toxin-antitoxin system SymE family toxin n=1 Tax=Zunongwangia pacifica TaxID=2911062 RepID=A0A9X2CQF0_9FLAO|nr:SymE family type I addiction module toxin [Zunongwangia pacifica]MCL6219693.1 type I toxin-antitoxin system SymE family toxin [Zunongwangia pacifica]